MRKNSPVLIHAGIVILGLLPLAVVLWRLPHDQLGPNPIEAIEHQTGDWTIRLLLATLAVTPLRRVTGWNGLIRYRRTIGLLAFTWVTLHFLTYLVIDQGFPIQGFAISYVAEDIAKRPYITVGFTAFLLLIPLAWTSTKGWIRRLGRRWTRLHQLIYVAAALGVLHYLWLIRGDRPTAIYYGLVLVGLLIPRVVRLRASGTRRTPSQRVVDLPVPLEQ
jgi:sulfoxide reductase heme-binding subunit YedZ